MPENIAHYHACLLRLWRADNDGNPVWRFTLVPPVSGEHRVFTDLEDLGDFLQALMENTGPSDETTCRNG